MRLDCCMPLESGFFEVPLCVLDGAADVGDSLALSDQLLSGFELADDLLGGVAESFHGGVPDPVWAAEDSNFHP